MKINEINRTDFGFKSNLITKTTRIYVPGKENTTIRCFLKDEFNTKTNTRKTIEFSYDILKNGKTLSAKKYTNKKGFSDNRLTSIYCEIEKNVRQGINFFKTFVDALAEEGN